MSKAYEPQASMKDYETDTEQGTALADAIDELDQAAQAFFAALEAMFAPLHTERG